MRHWGEYKALTAALQLQMGKWWRQARPWVIAALVVGVAWVPIEMLAYSLASTQTNSLGGNWFLYLFLSVIGRAAQIFPHVVALWLWLRAAQAVDPVLAGLDDTAGAKLPASPSRLRFMAYIVQGRVPVGILAVMAVAELLVLLMMDIARAVRLLDPWYIKLDLMGDFMSIGVNPLLAGILPLLLLLAYVAFSRKWNVAYIYLLTVIAFRLISIGFSLGERLFNPDAAYGSFYRTIPLAYSSALGILGLASLLWSARRGLTRLALGLFIFCLLGMACKGLNRTVIQTATDSLSGSVGGFIIDLAEAPYEFLVTVPLRVVNFEGTDNSPFQKRQLVFAWYRIPKAVTHGIAGYWTIYAELLGNLLWLLLVYLAMLRYADERYSLQQLKTELRQLKTELRQLKHQVDVFWCSPRFADSQP